MEAFRDFMSQSAKLYYRVQTGFMDGMFDSTNARHCGSRLVQMDEVWNRLILTQDLDQALYLVASLTAISSYGGYNCYFALKESLIASLLMFTDFTNFHAIDNQSILDLLWYNQIYYSKEIFTSLRYIRKMLTEKINLRTIYPPTIQSQKDQYVLWTHIGRVCKYMVSLRRSDWKHDYSTKIEYY